MLLRIRVPARRQQGGPGDGFRALVLLLSLVLLLICVLVSLGVGSSTLPVSSVLHYLAHPDDSFDSYVVNDLRVSRTIVGVLVGLALAVAGAVMQAVTRNPLAEPGLLGVNSGASLAIVVGAFLAGATSVRAQFLLAFLGAIVSTLVVYAIGFLGGDGASPARLVLVGVAFSAISGSVVQGLLLRRPDVFDTFRSWDVGALTRVDLPLTAVSVLVGLGMVGALVSARGLTDLSLGDDVAASLGTNLVLLRCSSLMSLALLCGAATAAAGPIAFVGLMVPLTGSWLMGPHRGWVIALSAVLGPVLVLLADVLGRLIARPAEMQVGLLTAFVGSPVLLWMAMRFKGRTV